jgi:hypothetical protein
MLFAAASSTTAVLVFFRIDSRACGWEMSPGRSGPLCSHWYVAAAALTWCAWFFNLVITALIALLLVVFIHHGQD